ncbi:alpha/beta fold hydrolase [Oscillospiraceae bacterium 50-60]
MKSKNRLTALLLGGAMVLSLLAGCAGTPVNDGAPAAAPNGPHGEARQEAEARIPEGALVIAEQGIFSAGGITVTSEGTFDPENHFEETGAGQTAHVDHANVLYQIPAEETGLPMVFLHGYGQSRMGWMTTPDGRPGWSDLFLRMGHSVFLIDGPRRGEAGATSVSGEISTKTLDQRWYTQFRIGRWENGKSVPNEGSQFPNDDESVNQFFRQMTPDTGMRSDMGGDFDNETVARAAAAAIDEVYARTGRDSILVTHSQGGGPGWTAAQYTDHIAAIVAVEPGGAPAADSPDFQAVLEKKIPVTMYFGDYIDNGDPAIMATMMWQGMRGACYAFRDAYNEAGGNCTVVDLPQEGITGNDHFIFQDLNNDVVADHVEAWIQANVQ